MKEPDSNYEEAIRRALSAAGDLVVPAGDGLSKIRERAARRPFALRLALRLRDLPAPAVVRGAPAGRQRAHRHLGRLLTPDAGLRSARRLPGQGARMLRTPTVWFRPIVAAVGALLLVLAVTLAIPRLRETVASDSPAEPDGRAQRADGPGGSGGGNPQSNGASGLSTTSAGNTTSGSASASGSTRCATPAGTAGNGAHQSSAAGLPPSTGAGNKPVDRRRPDLRQGLRDDARSRSRHRNPVVFLGEHIAGALPVEFNVVTPSSSRYLYLPAPSSSSPTTTPSPSSPSTSPPPSSPPPTSTPPSSPSPRCHPCRMAPQTGSPLGSPVPHAGFQQPAAAATATRRRATSGRSG